MTNSAPTTSPKSPDEAPTVLLVEDEAALQEAAKFKLAQEGIVVITASDGLQALKLLESTRPTLVWLDLLLPGMNGMEVLRHIRADERLKDLPVIVVSVSAGEEKIKEALGLKAIDYIVKSQYTIDSIVKRVKDIVSKL